MPDAVSPSFVRFSDEIASLVESVAPGVVAVQSDRTWSSGFVWRPGLIVTADEALPDDGAVSIAARGAAAVAATVVGRDAATDVALLRVADGKALQALSLTQVSLRVGELVVTVGARDGSPAAHVGNVAFVGEPWRSVRGGRIDARIEIDTTLRRSAEGGVVLDAHGRAFGMAVFGPRRRILVIPASTIDRVAEQLLSHGRVARGYLGLRLQRVPLDGRDGAGAMVLAVDTSGPAAAAGIRQGDVVATFDGKDIANVHSLARDLGDRAGESVRLSVLRGGVPLDIALTIGERPAP